MQGSIRQSFRPIGRIAVGFRVDVIADYKREKAADGLENLLEVDQECSFGASCICSSAK